MKTKKLMGFLVLGFLIFFILESPVDAAELFRDVGSFVQRVGLEAARSLSAFLRSLT